jgi:endonuclease/exonuclease/phosphatase family metal-dependent hydrolase
MMNAQTNSPKLTTRILDCRTAGSVLLTLGLLSIVKPEARAYDCNTFEIMTFNIRYDEGWACAPEVSPCGEWNAWARTLGRAARRDLVELYMERHDPDIFGLQEVKDPVPSPGIRYSQLADVADWYDDYDYVAYDNGTGDYLPIFWWTGRFSEVNSGVFWLSCAPDVVGSIPPWSTHNIPRIATWAILADSYTQQNLFVINSHWDLSEPSREYGAALIRERVDDLAGDLPVLILGDFNAAETETSFQILTGHAVWASSCPPRVVPPADLPLVNTYRDVHPSPSGEDETTYHAWGENTWYPRIDHILHSEGDFLAVDAVIDRASFQVENVCEGNHCYASDHYAVYARILVRMNHVRVDFSYPSSLCERGTSSHPYNDLGSGSDAVRPGHTLHMKAGSTTQGFTFDQPMTVVAEGGSVTIGGS